MEHSRTLFGPERFAAASQINRRRIGVLLLLFAFLAVLQPTVAHSAFNAYLNATPNPNDGDYTLTWSRPSGRLNLQERFNSGSWSVIASGASLSSSMTFTNKQPGVYEYRLERTYLDCLDGRSRRNCESVTEYSISELVTVNGPTLPLPVVDDFEAQMVYQFVARTGDINSDGLQDVFIQRTSGDLDNGVVSEAFMLRLANGTYARLVPSQGQVTAAQLWPTIAVETQVGDFNFDEVGDLVVGNLPGSDNMQILLSSGVFYDRNATAIIDVDEERLQYFEDLSNWIVDDNYFDNAGEPDLPGYNIKIIYRVTTCYWVFGFPACFSFDITLVDIDVSLPDLGLDDYLNVQSKVSPGGVSAEAVGAYYSPTVHSAASVQLAQDGVSNLVGTSAEKTVALSTMADVVPSSPPPDVLICVFFCGYYVDFFYDGYQVVSWFDIWTPITITGAFDDENFSAEAHQVSLILDDWENNGADFGSQQDWDNIAAITSELFAVPIDVPFPDDRPKVKLGPLARFFIGIWALHEAYVRIDAVVQRIRWGYHYTGPLGAAGISASGTIISASGQVFVTPIIYSTGQQADELLALCGELVTRRFVVRIPFEEPAIIIPVLRKTCPPGSLQAGRIRSGGGVEQVILPPATVLPPRSGIAVAR